MASSTKTGGRAATRGVIPGRIALSVGTPEIPTRDGYQWRLLTDLARLESGHTPSRNRDDYWDGDIPWIGIRDATANHGRVLNDTQDHVSQLGLDNSSARLLPAGTVCLSRTASVGFVVEMGRPMATSQDFVNWVCGPELNPRYLRYILQLEQESVRRFAHGTTHQTMYYPEAKALTALLPARPVQDAVVGVLGALDDKITANENVLAAAGELLAAEYVAALVPRARTVPLEDLAEFHNRRRVPLSSRERDARRGRVPYYGAAGRLDYVDQALFDEPLVLVGEDGSVINDDGSPVMQYIWGPSWVNNHAHVLTGKGIATETLRCALERANVTHLVTGAVQPKISMGNLKRLELTVPDDASAIDVLAKRSGAMLRSISDQNSILTRTRDELLPLFMSGKLRLKDAEAVASEVL